MALRSGRHEVHEENDEGWIVSYADLVTLMLGFFILMYKAVATEGTVKKLEKEIGEALLGQKRPVMEHVVSEVTEERKARAFQLLVKMLNLGENDEQAVGNIEKKYAKVAHAEDLKNILVKELSPKSKEYAHILGVSQHRDDVSLRVVIPTDTTFERGEATLNPSAQRHIEELAASLLPMGDLIDVEITGHTDDLPMGNQGRWATNWELSCGRAATIGALLRKSGLPGEKLKISGLAHYSPAVSVKGLTGEALDHARAKNRRIELTIKRKKPDPSSVILKKETPQP